MDSRCPFQADPGGRRVELSQLRELGVEAEVRRRRPPAEHELLPLDQPIHDLQESPVACFDHRCGDVVGADHVEPRDLPIGDEGLELLKLRLRGLNVGPAWQDGSRHLDVRIVMPAVVEHGLGEPLVGVVLDQVVQEGQHRIGGNRLASRELGFEAADERRGVHLRLQLAFIVWQIEGW